MTGLEPHKPYTNEEVRERLMEIRDRSLDNSVAMSRQNKLDGLASWQNVMSRANAEIDRLDLKESGGQPVNLICNGFDVTRLVFGSNYKPQAADE